MKFLMIIFGRVFIVFFLVIITEPIYGQQEYEYKISFSGPVFKKENLSIRFYKGYESVLIPGTSSIITGKNISFLSFPVLEFMYFSPGRKPTIYRFFISKQKSEVNFVYDNVSDDIILKRKSGLLNFADVGQDKFMRYAKSEWNRLNEFSSKFNNDFTGADEGSLQTLNEYYQAIKDKGLTFIKNYPKELYSLWIFMIEIVGDPRYANTDLLDLYRQYFGMRYAKTFEENYILEKLSESRLNVNTPAPFTNIIFTDLSGESYALNSFKEKYVLVNIWATWCVPCVAEIPMLKSLHEKYPELIEIISFSIDGNEDKVKRFIADQNITWKNVFGRSDIGRIYGSDNGIPQVYLLGKDGTILYSRRQSKDYDLILLEKLIEKLYSQKN